MADLLDSVISNSPIATPGDEQAGGTRARQSLELGNKSSASDVSMTHSGQRRPNASVYQAVSTGSDSTLENVGLKTEVYAVETEYYFELTPFEVIETTTTEGARYERLSPGAPLRAGRTYRVSVSLSKNKYGTSFQSEGTHYQLVQSPFKLESEVFLQLSVGGRDQNVFDAVGDITPAQGRLSLDHPTPSENFYFTVQKDYRLELTLELFFHRGDEPKLLYPAATLTLRLDGNQAAPPPAIGEILHLPSSLALPPDTAILYVCEGNAGSLMLVGWLGERLNSSSLEAGTFAWVDPEDCPDEVAYLQKVTDSFHDYNLERAADVSEWFAKALVHFGEQCSIVIVDEAGALIPWEMFKLPDGRFLGAHALVVRWAAAQYSGGQNVSLVTSPKYEGRLSAYIHPRDVARMSKVPEMNRLLTGFSQTPMALERDLRPGGGTEQVALVYLCYGGILYYGDEGSLKHLSRFKPYEDDVKIRFNNIGGTLNPRPIFFANAPYSGRVIRSGQQSVGLARATLKQVAAGYIGTLGPVDHAYAARFAQRLLEAAASDEGVKPAELLRLMRVEAIKQLDNKELTAEEYEHAYMEFAYPFMYVYYGHPQDWLKISLAPELTEKKGADEHV